jgi:hypothetical protein
MASSPSASYGRMKASTSGRLISCMHSLPKRSLTQPTRSSSTSRVLGARTATILPLCGSGSPSATAWRQRCRPVIVRGNQEVVTATGHVGNLGGAPRALVEFRSGGAVFGLALAPSFLRAICSNRSFGIAKFAVNVCPSDTNKNANKTDGWSELLPVFSMHRQIFPRNPESNQCLKILLLLVFFTWCPWPVAV